uniref:Uncharacterized protein n=1 Tax=Glossina pallidipes TaxID=7398 RepID=A0A1A9ZEE3_GLOPL
MPIRTIGSNWMSGRGDDEGNTCLTKTLNSSGSDCRLVSSSVRAVHNIYQKNSNSNTSSTFSEQITEPPPPSLPTRVRKTPSRITSAAAPLPSPLPTLYAKHSLRSLCLGLKLIVLLTSFIIFLIKLPVLLGTAGFVIVFSTSSSQILKDH